MLPSLGWLLCCGYAVVHFSTVEQTYSASLNRPLPLLRKKRTSNTTLIRTLNIDSKDYRRRSRRSLVKAYVCAPLWLPIFPQVCALKGSSRSTLHLISTSPSIHHPWLSRRLPNLVL